MVYEATTDWFNGVSRWAVFTPSGVVVTTSKTHSGLVRNFKRYMIRHKKSFRTKSGVLKANLLWHNDSRTEVIVSTIKVLYPRD